MGWHRSRLGFVTPCIREVSLGPLDSTHHKKLPRNVTKELATGSCITVRVKRLAGNEIEQGIGIPTIDLGQVTYRLTKGIVYGID